jgi:hypothetical protein
MCPLLVLLKIGFFSFFFTAAVYGTNEANQAGATCSKAVYNLLNVYATSLQKAALLERKAIEL